LQSQIPRNKRDRIRLEKRLLRGLIAGVAAQALALVGRIDYLGLAFGVVLILLGRFIQRGQGEIDVTAAGAAMVLIEVFAILLIHG